MVAGNDRTTEAVEVEKDNCNVTNKHAEIAQAMET